MKRISDELAKNMVNQSKLSERYRKNSGKGTNLFILNPSNKKKFSTVRIIWEKPLKINVHIFIDFLTFLF